jgi:hypothetical protein
MYVSILNFREGEVEIIEVDDVTITDEHDIQKRLGHSDFHYMTTETLKLKVNNEC